MTLLGCLLLLTGVISCTAAPAPGGSCGVPPRFDDKELQGDWDEESYSPGTQALYECRPGFSRLGSIQYVCSDGEWIFISRGQCRKKSCGHPGDIDFSTFELRNEKDFVFGAVVEYTCNVGFQMISKHSTRECKATGWTNPRIECGGRGSCGVPPRFNDTELQDDWDEIGYHPGTKAMYMCRPDFSRLGSIRFCSDGEWILLHIGHCIIPCGVPPRFDDKELQGDWDEISYSPGTQAQYLCRPGFSQLGSIRYVCSDGEWILLSIGQCKRLGAACGAPPVIQFGDTIDTRRQSYPSGSSVRYKCSSYYKLEGKESVTCRDGEWEPEPVCRAPCTVSGSDLEQNNIQWKYQSGEDKTRKIYSEHSDYMTFECRQGFWLSELKSVQCLDGVVKYPKCRKEGAACGTPPVIQFGDTIEVRRQSYPSGSSVRYKCANYYKLEGKETLTCRDGEWEPEPVCRAPCTVSGSELEQNNIQWKYRRGEDKTSKLYSEHFDHMTFECRKGYLISDVNLLRAQCLDGVVKYPKCLKKGEACNVPPVVQFGDTIEGMRQSYPLVSSVRYTCADYYKLEGKETVTCKDGEWEEAPVCRVPCYVTERELEQNNIQWRHPWGEDKTRKLYAEHSDYMTFECRGEYRISDENLLRVQCLDGVAKYPKCL